MYGVSQHHPQPGALDQEHPTPEAHSDPQGFNIQPFVPTQAAPHLALSFAPLLRVPFAPQGPPPPVPGPSQQPGPALAASSLGISGWCCHGSLHGAGSLTTFGNVSAATRVGPSSIRARPGPAGHRACWGLEGGETSAAGQPGASSWDRRPRGHLSSSPCQPCRIGVLQGRGGGLGVRVGNGRPHGLQFPTSSLRGTSGAQDLGDGVFWKLPPSEASVGRVGTQTLPMLNRC